MTSTTPNLAHTDASERKLQTIYICGFCITVLLGGFMALWLRTGGRLQGPAIAATTFIVGVLVLCVGMSAYRRVQHRTLRHVLLHEPQRVLRVFPRKKTQTLALGQELVSYSWIVLELDDGRLLDLYAPPNRFGLIMREIVHFVPGARYDPEWNVQEYSARPR